MIKLYKIECIAKDKKETLVSTYKTMEECMEIGRAHV